jgi:PTS system nitrogen regulatory IIA component
LDLSQLITKDLVVLDLECHTKSEAIEILVDRLVQANRLPHKEEILRVIMEREELASTGIGNGVALPHGRIDAIDQVFIVFGRVKAAIDFDALDGAPVTLIFLIVSPIQQNESYLKALSSISRLLKNEKFRNTLLEAKCPEAIIEDFAEEDETSNEL